MPGRRSVPLAWRILTHDKIRFGRSLAGITFAVLLIFGDIGFLNGLYDNQVEVIQQLNADIVITNKLKHSLVISQPFARRRLYQARALPEVEAADPLYIDTAFGWKNPDTGKVRWIRVLAFRPDRPVFLNADIVAHAAALKFPHTVLMDARAKAHFGRRQPGVATELAGKSVRVVGSFQLGTDFANEGNVVMSDYNFPTYFPSRSASESRLSQVELGVVRIAPHADVAAVVTALRRLLPDDVSIYTKRAYLERELFHWKHNTPLGPVFLLGAILGFVIGVMICYQILYTEVVDHLPQFATTMALGYHKRFLIGVVMKQALVLSCLGFGLGLLSAIVFYDVVAEQTGLLMRLTVSRAILVFTLTVAMCMVSGGLAIRKAVSPDPAEVFA